MDADKRPVLGAGPEFDFYSVFNVFSQAMEHDFVGAGRGAHPVGYQPYMEEFGQKLWKGQGYTVQFCQYMEEYLLAFKTRGVRFAVDHAKTPYYPAYTYGMRVRAYGDDALYVTEFLPGCPFRCGDKVVNGSVYGEGPFRSVASLRGRLGASLYGETPEREVWDPLLHYVNRYLVETAEGGDQSVAISVEELGDKVHLPEGYQLRVGDESKTRRVKCERLALPARPAPYQLDERADMLVLTLRDLSDEAGFEAFVSANAAMLGRARSLVVDVRRCEGGSEAAALPLLPYLLARPISLASYMESVCLTNYSRHNVERQTAELDAVAAGYADDVEALASIAQWKEELASMSGKGVVEEPYGIPEEFEASVEPAGSCAKVALLTDVDTCDAADLLAEVCRDSERAVTVGRATRGSRGFSNPATVVKEAFTLQYPTSRFTDEGLARHFAGVGVPPQVYIPWTPEHLEHDADLEAAVQALR